MPQTFYIFALSVLTVSGTGTAFWFHLRRAFRESGLSEITVAAIYPLISGASYGQLGAMPRLTSDTPTYRRR